MTISPIRSLLGKTKPITDTSRSKSPSSSMSAASTCTGAFRSLETTCSSKTPRLVCRSQRTWLVRASQARTSTSPSWSRSPVFTFATQVGPSSGCPIACIRMKSSASVRLVLFPLRDEVPAKSGAGLQPGRTRARAQAEIDAACRRIFRGFAGKDPMGLLMGVDHT